MLHVSIPHCMPEKISKTSKTDNCFFFVWSTLHHLFLLCLFQHELPSEWRENLIIPIFKSGDASLVKNYRLISLLCTTSEILEKLIYDKVISSSIFSFQFTTQQLLLFLNKIHDSLTTHSQADLTSKKHLIQ